MHFSRDVKIRQGRRQRDLKNAVALIIKKNSTRAAFPSRQDGKIPKLRVNKRP